MKIDKDKALEILKAEVTAARDGDEPVPTEWVELVRDLEDACGNLNKTFFAALATALLARSTNDRVDVYSLKVGQTERGYSARSLCQHVLAAYAPRLGINLGVKGREPLNNQPFFAEDQISDALPVKPHAKPALELLLEALGKLDGMDCSEARLALRAFLRARQLEDNSWVIDPNASGGVRLAVVSDRITSFVAEKSELGKRAQAVADSPQPGKMAIRPVGPSSSGNPDYSGNSDCSGNSVVH